MPIKHLIWLIMVLLSSCDSTNQGKQNSAMSNQPLEETLLNIGYPKRFMYGNTKTVDSLWQEGKNKYLFLQLVTNSNSSWHSRFLALEVLHHKGVQPDTAYNHGYAQAYAYALLHTSEDHENQCGLNGNSWGVPHEKDDLGILGERLIAY